MQIALEALIISRVFPYYKVIRRNGRVDVYAGAEWCFAGSYWR